MSTIPTPQTISIQEYLAGEQYSSVRHEHVAGADVVIELPAINAALPLSGVYDGIEFPPTI